MSNNNGLEIERKYLIERPTEEALAAFPGAYKYEIEQIYLPAGADGEAARIRRRTNESETEYFYTVKRRISELVRIENEKRISADEYVELAREAGDAPAYICKTRWCLPYNDHIIEVDIYPFWHRIAVAEVELENELDTAALPPELRVLRDVTGERAYLNKTMAYEMQKNGCLKEPKL